MKNSCFLLFPCLFIFLANHFTTPFSPKNSFSSFLPRINQTNKMTDANTNTAYGYEAGSQASTSTILNSAFGIETLYQNDANYNAAFGAYALNANTTGQQNVAIGANSMLLNTEGNYNVAVGTASLCNATTGSWNVAIGACAALNHTTGNSNICIGTNTNQANVTGNDNIAIGRSAMSSNTSNQNIGIGSYALSGNTAGINCVAVGHESQLYSSVSVSNVSVGAGSLRNVGGDGSAASQNTAIGDNSGYNLTSGTLNTFLGSNAGQLSTTGSNCTCLGYEAQTTSPTANNEIILGNSNISYLQCQVGLSTPLVNESDVVSSQAVDPNKLQAFLAALQAPRIYILSSGKQVFGYSLQNVRNALDISALVIPGLITTIDSDKCFMNTDILAALFQLNGSLPPP